MSGGILLPGIMPLVHSMQIARRTLGEFADVGHLRAIALSYVKYEDLVRAERLYAEYGGKADPLERDAVRRAYGRAGYLSDRATVITPENMRVLRNKINDRMRFQGMMEGTFHMQHSGTIQVVGGDHAYCALRCHSYYFQDREAVTFNADGFVGFAGWADDTNVQPILLGFMDWLDWMRGEVAAGEEVVE